MGYGPYELDPDNLRYLQRWLDNGYVLTTDYYRHVDGHLTPGDGTTIWTDQHDLTAAELANRSAQQRWEQDQAWYGPEGTIMPGIAGKVIPVSSNPVPVDRAAWN